MTISIAIFDRPVLTGQPQRPIHRAEGSTMARAEASARRWCQHWHLAGEGPDATVYAYDCLGGLRFEARRRDNAVSIR